MTQVAEPAPMTVEEPEAVRQAGRPSPLARLGRALLTGLFVVVFALFVLGPIVWLALHAFAGRWDFPSLLPQEWTLRWWRDVISDPDLLGSIRVSFVTAPVVVLVSAVICLPAAYAYSRYSFPGRQAMLVSLFATNAFPKIGLFVALAGLFYSLHLMQTYVGVIIVQLLGTLVFMTWIPAAAFASVPRSLEEAARDVGAGPLRVFFRVTLPIASPGILVAMILSFIAAFDEAQGTYLVGAPAYITMPTEMYIKVLNLPAAGAAVFSILLSIPSAILLLAVRKHVMGGRFAEGFQLR